MRPRKAVLITFLIAFLGFSTALDIESDTIDPPSYAHNQTLDHIFNNVDIEGMSGDGDPDTLYFSFPETVRLDPRNVTADVPVSSEPRLVDRDHDGVKESVKVELNPQREGKVAAEVTLNTAAWLRGHRDVIILTEIQDSKYGVAADNGTMTFEGNKMAFEHREDEHPHYNDFSDATTPPPVCITGNGLLARVARALTGRR